MTWCLLGGKEAAAVSLFRGEWVGTTRTLLRTLVSERKVGKKGGMGGPGGNEVRRCHRSVPRRLGDHLASSRAASRPSAVQPWGHLSRHSEAAEILTTVHRWRQHPGTSLSIQTWDVWRDRPWGTGSAVGVAQTEREREHVGPSRWQERRGL